MAAVSMERRDGFIIVAAIRFVFLVSVCTGTYS